MSSVEKLKGDIVEAKFQYLALEKGFLISRPYGDNSKYDFILDFEGSLKRIQIKSTNKLRPNGGYQVKGSYGGKTSKTIYNKSHIDFLIAYIIDLDIWYIIPINNLNSASLDVFPTISNSRAKYEKFKEKWDLLKN